MTDTQVLFLICSVSFAGALAMTPLARRLALKTGFIDQPNQRKVHGVAIPLMGGVAICGAVLGALFLCGHHYVQELFGILSAAFLLFVVGLIDDRRHLPCSVRLAVQTTVAVYLYFNGVQVRLHWLPDSVNCLLTLLWLVGITNASNLLDNMDGLNGGISAIAAAFFTVMAALHGQFMVASLSAAVLGACIGFLVFNSRPASIFMGDAGSLFLGLLLAVIGIKLRFPDNVNMVTWMVPVLVMGIPIFDTTLVFVSRLRRGLNPLTAAGKDHTSHRLVDHGFSHLRAVIILYGGAIVCGMLGWWVLKSSWANGYKIGAGALVVAVWLLWRMEWTWKKG